MAGEKALEFLLKLNSDEFQQKAAAARQEMAGLTGSARETGNAGGNAAVGLDKAKAAMAGIKDGAVGATREMNLFQGVLGESAIAAGKSVLAMAGMAAAIKAISAATREAAEKQEIKIGFQELATSVGLSSDKILAKVREVTSGTVSNSNIMKAATHVMAVGIKADEEQIARLFEIARLQSRRFQMTTTEAFDTLVQGINSGMPRMLRRIGFEFPEALETAMASMTDTEKKAALLNLVFEQGTEKIQAVGGVTETAADGFRRLDVASGRLASSVKSLFLQLAPLADVLATVTNRAADFLDVYAKIMSGDFTKFQVNPLEGKSFLELSQMMEKKRVELLSAQSQPSPADSFRRSDSGGSLPETLQNLSPAQVQAVTAEIDRIQKQMDLELGKAGKLLDGMKEGSQSFLEVVKSIVPGFNGIETKEWANEKKQKVREAAKAMEDFQKTLGQARQKEEELDQAIAGSRWANDIEQWITDMQRAGEETTAILAINGKMAQGFSAATSVVAGLSSAYLDLSDTVAGLVKEATSEKATSAWSNLAWVIGQTTSGLAQVSDIATADPEIYKRLREEAEAMKRAQVEFKEALTVNVRDAFEEGMLASLEGGDFWDAFGRNMATQLRKALVAGISGQIFGVGGTNGQFNMQSMLFGGGAPSADMAMANTTASYPGGGGQYVGAGSGGLLGSLFKNPWASGKFSWSALGTNILTGAAVSIASQRLFGEGGLFGSRKVNGSEAIDQASAINQQVQEAVKQRDAMLTTAVGLSRETIDMLRELKFASAGYTWDDSGDGIFAKKTRTYALDASAANKSLEEFAAAAKKAEFEMAQRSYDIAITAMDRPFTALEMQLADLRDAIDRAEAGSQERLDLQLQLAQIERQQLEFWRGNRTAWTSYFLGTPFGDMGGDRSISYAVAGGKPAGMMTNIIAQPVEGAAGTDYRPWSQVNGTFSPTATAWALGVQGGGGYPRGAQYMVGGKAMTEEEFQQYFGTLVQITGLRNQGAAQFELSSQLAGGANLWETSIGGKNYMDLLAGRIEDYAGGLAAIEARIANVNTSTADREALYTDWQNVNAAFWTAKQEYLDLEQQMADEAARKEEEAANKLKEREGKMRAFSLQYAGFIDDALLFGPSSGYSGLKSPYGVDLPTGNGNIVYNGTVIGGGLGAKPMPQGQIYIPDETGSAIKVSPLMLSAMPAGVMEIQAGAPLRPRDMGGSFVAQPSQTAVAVGPGIMELPDETGSALNPFTLGPQADLEAMLNTVQKSGQFNYAIRAAQIGGTELWDIPEYWQALTERIDDLQKIMDNAEAKARDASLTMEERESWFQTFSDAQTALLDSKLEYLQTEADKGAKLKAQQETRRDDILSSLSMIIGETSEVAGQKVIIVNSQNEVSDFLRELRDDLDPEARKLFDALTATRKFKTRWG